MSWIHKVLGLVPACSDACRDEKAWLRDRVAELEKYLLAAKINRPVSVAARPPAPETPPFSEREKQLVADMKRAPNLNVREFGRVLEAHEVTFEEHGYVSHDPFQEMPVILDDAGRPLNVYQGVEVGAGAGNLFDADDEAEIQDALERIGKAAG